MDWSLRDSGRRPVWLRPLFDMCSWDLRRSLTAAQGGAEASLDSLQSLTRFSIRRLDRQQLRSFVKRAFEEAIERGEIKPEVSPVAMSALLAGMLRGASTQLLLDRNAFDVEDARAQVHFVLRSLSETKSK